MWKNPLPGVPPIESPFFEQIAETHGWDQETYRVGQELRKRGYAVIDFPAKDLDSMVEDIIGDLTPRYDWEGWKQEGWSQREGLRIQDAWQLNDSVRRIATDPDILALLSRLYGRAAFPFQTLNFPVGTQQDIHSDSTHFSSVPERFMCGVWLAFEDVGNDNGALEYYPGSHKLPIYTNEHIGACAAVSEYKTAHYSKFLELWRQLAELHGLRKETFHAKKGQALIWSANLLHGGSAHRDPERTRWSQVTHYYFDGCCYYTPVSSDPFFGSIHYRHLANVASGEVQQNVYSGCVVPGENIAWSEKNMDTHKSHQRPLPAGFDPALYLQANPDVAATGVDASWHWRTFGYLENRMLRP